MWLYPELTYLKPSPMEIGACAPAAIVPGVNTKASPAGWSWAQPRSFGRGWKGTKCDIDEAA